MIKVCNKNSRYYRNNETMPYPSSQKSSRVQLRYKKNHQIEETKSSHKTQVKKYMKLKLTVRMR